MRNRATTLVVLLCLTGGLRGQPPAVTIYDDDSSHLWNRLHRALLVRNGTQKDQLVGLDSVDPILWANTKHLLHGESHRQATMVLDDFLKTHGEQLIDDPLKRAILQRDLWAIFDFSCGDGAHRNDYVAERAALQERLARVIRRVALTRKQIADLPDTYAAQAARLADDSIVPADVRDPKGAWIDLLRPGEGVAAPLHQRSFGGRSVFNAFLRHPGGRAAGLDYLNRLSVFEEPFVSVPDPAQPDRKTLQLNPNLPQLPAGTRVALLRRAMLIDSDGNLAVTNFAEMVQLRAFVRVPAVDEQPRREDQTFDEFVFTRRGLFNDPASALRRRAPDERDILHVQFTSHGIDWIEAPPNRPGEVRELTYPVFQDCFGCHSGRGIQSVNTFTRMFGPRTDRPSLTDGSPGSQDGYAILYKHERFDWGLLQGLIRRETGD